MSIVGDWKLILFILVASRDLLGPKHELLAHGNVFIEIV